MRTHCVIAWMKYGTGASGQRGGRFGSSAQTVAGRAGRQGAGRQDDGRVTPAGRSVLDAQGPSTARSLHRRRHAGNRRGGGGGNRTRVLWLLSRPSPSAAGGGVSGPALPPATALVPSRPAMSPTADRPCRSGEPYWMTPVPDPQGWGRTDGLRVTQPARLDSRRLCWFPALLRGSGDHGSLLLHRRPESKPITPLGRPVLV